MKNCFTRTFDFSVHELPSVIFNLTADGVMLTDLQRIIIDVNPVFEQITGYTRSDIIGKTPRVLSSGVHNPEFYQAMNETLKQQGYWCGDIWNRKKDGTIYLENLSITAINDPDNEPAFYLAMLRDITKQNLYKEKLRNESLYDPLTQLPNRKLLAEKLQSAIHHANQNNKQIAVYFLDLDAFKAINDSIGHNAGDKVLTEVSKNLAQCLRDDDHIARVGGDEFAGVISNLENHSDCFPILHRILRAASQPLKINDRLVSLSASIGVTFYPQQSPLEGEQLLRQADVAMYEAKQSGKNVVKLYDEIDASKERKNKQVLDEISLAIKQNQLILLYQPKINMQTGECIGVEALIRWQHPHRGLLSPNRFIPLIEEHALSIDLGYWVIENALKQISQWQSLGFSIPVSVNITSKHIHQDDFLANLKQLLSVYPHVTPQFLELEIVESSVLYDVDRVADVIQQCNELGVAVSLDDFGSGYSSLSYLRKLPVSKLKIDRSFTSNIQKNTADLSIIEAVMALANAFNCEVIAEGIENEEQGLLLLKLGCNKAQGYFISKPTTSEQIIKWLEQKMTVGSWRQQIKLEDEALLLTYAIVEHRGWLEK
ncbi:putative bifunctional diguanylate cyclase/phosphodiesterase [Alteromonas sp. 14N.309.X.WAT.G.H12]|uniref:putative bifunctional diguanylate cyclase/phosphodiesterase n=1 Tax=Alteromonas sp. 14N.309.X.WAT.G.H12 TaxID=3120824 RepID=UPI002FD0441C